MDNDDEDDGSSDDDNGNGEAARAAPRLTQNGATSSGKDNTGHDPVLGSSGRSRGHLSSKGSTEWGDNYCLRALRCACELRSHRDEHLGTHIAVTAGTLSLAVLGGCMDEWTYVVNGASTIKPHARAHTLSLPIFSYICPPHRSPPALQARVCPSCLRASIAPGPAKSSARSCAWTSPTAHSRGSKRCTKALKTAPKGRQEWWREARGPGQW